MSISNFTKGYSALMSLNKSVFGWTKTRQQPDHREFDHLQVAFRKTLQLFEEGIHKDVETTFGILNRGIDGNSDVRDINQIINLGLELVKNVCELFDRINLHYVRNENKEYLEKIKTINLKFLDFNRRFSTQYAECIERVIRSMQDGWGGVSSCAPEIEKKLNLILVRIYAASITMNYFLLRSKGLVVIENFDGLVKNLVSPLMNEVCPNAVCNVLTLVSLEDMVDVSNVEIHKVTNAASDEEGALPEELGIEDEKGGPNKPYFLFVENTICDVLTFSKNDKPLEVEFVQNVYLYTKDERTRRLNMRAYNVKLGNIPKMSHSEWNEDRRCRFSDVTDTASDLSKTFKPETLNRDFTTNFEPKSRVEKYSIIPCTVCIVKNYVLLLRSGATFKKAIYTKGTLNYASVPYSLIVPEFHIKVTDVQRLKNISKPLFEFPGDVIQVNVNHSNMFYIGGSNEKLCALEKIFRSVNNIDTRKSFSRCSFAYNYPRDSLLTHQDSSESMSMDQGELVQVENLTVPFVNVPVSPVSYVALNKIEPIELFRCKVIYYIPGNNTVADDEFTSEKKSPPCNGTVSNNHLDAINSVLFFYNCKNRNWLSLQMAKSYRILFEGNIDNSSILVQNESIDSVLDLISVADYTHVVKWLKFGSKFALKNSLLVFNHLKTASIHRTFLLSPLTVSTSNFLHEFINTNSSSIFSSTQCLYSHIHSILHVTLDAHPTGNVYFNAASSCPPLKFITLENAVVSVYCFTIGKEFSKEPLYVIGIRSPSLYNYIGATPSLFAGSLFFPLTNTATYRLHDKLELFVPSLTANYATRITILPSKNTDLNILYNVCSKILSGNFIKGDNFQRTSCIIQE